LGVTLGNALRGRFQGGGVSTVEPDMRTSLGQCVGDGQTQTAGSAGHQGLLSAQVEALGQGGMGRAHAMIVPLMNQRPISPPNACPCGLTAPYRSCCGRYHQGDLAGEAPDPEALMRSRYSAFVLDLRDYLLETWHASERPAQIDAPEPGLRWLGLSVLQAAQTGDDQGWVNFVARYKLGGRAHRLQERSLFIREGGRWYYLRADLSVADAQTLV
jgi:SEC-C motif-containing protein